MRMLRVGIVGAGSSARQHCEALEAVEDIKVARVCEPYPGSSAGWVTRMPLASFEDLLSDVNIDIIAVCTPPGTHHQFVTQALRCGKAVVVEKPVAATLAQFEQILRERERAGLPVGVMHQHRFVLPPDVLSTEWSTTTTASVEVFKFRPLDHYVGSPWRLDPDLAGGGAFAHLGIHYADLACQILGSPVVVQGDASCDFRPDIDTRVTLAVRFKSGAMLSLLCDCLATSRCERLTVRDGERSLEVLNGCCSWSPKRGDESVSKPLGGPYLRARVYSELGNAIRNGQVRLKRSDVESSFGCMFLLEAVSGILSRKKSGRVSSK